MPRHPRVHSPDLLYHILTRGNNRQRTFFNDDDYLKFIELLQTTKKNYPFRLYAYVLMPNHFHFLLQTQLATTSKIMQSLLTVYAKYFNATHKKRGHLFQGRYKAILCDKEPYFIELIRYIHLNPVRAHMVPTASAWPWSGHLEYTGQAVRRLVDFNLIRGIFGEGAPAHDKYVKFIQDGTDSPSQERFYPRENSPFLGTEEFVLKSSLIISTKNEETRKERLKMDAILSEIAQKAAICPDIIKQRSRSRTVSSVRKQFIRECTTLHGYTDREVADFLGRDHAYIARISHISPV